ncbi:MAG: hypothetical protein JKY96_04740 [Phycisphaerales bacterium]|nr:hypothetical protein [Phycisphaerales bacterium]
MTLVAKVTSFLEDNKRNKPSLKLVEAERLADLYGDIKPVLDDVPMQRFVGLSYDTGKTTI